MKTRRVRKTSSCLYMLGFMSGLLFVALCASSSLYEEFTASLPEAEEQNVSQLADNPQRVANPRASAPEDAIESPLKQEAVLDIQFQRKENGGDELIIRGLNFTPGESVRVSVLAEGQEIYVEDAQVDPATSFQVVYAIPPAYQNLTSITVIAKSDSAEARQTYPLPGLINGPGESATGTPSVPSATETPSSGPSPTAECPVCTVTLSPLPTATPYVPPPPPTITPTPSPTPVPLEPYYPNWRAEYFNNPTWTGQPAQMRDDPAISFEWGEDSPVPGVVGKNWFSVRWTRRIALPEGYYTFVLSADDQAVVFMNGQQILSYIGKAPSVNRLSIYVPGPEPVEFEVRFAEFWGEAHIQFYWEPDAGHCCWHLEYYKGANFSGESLFDKSVGGNDLRKLWYIKNSDIWQYVAYDAPFSARITRQLQAPGRRGAYYLCFYVQDSARLWLDDTLLIDHCDCAERGCLVCKAATLRKRPLNNINLEYSHAMGTPMLAVWTVPKVDKEPWIGAYFTNPDLAGLPLVVQTTASVNFNWGDAAPEPRLPPDAFSVRWMRTTAFVKGHYRFHLTIDDGARLRINNRVILDAWARGSEREYIVDYEVLTDKQPTDIEVEYFEATERAVAKLWWETPWPTHTPTPTATPSPTPTLTPSNTPTSTPPATATPCCYTPIPCVTATPAL